MTPAPETLAALAKGPFAQFAPVTQIAYCPADWDAALHYWTQVVGAGPFFLLEHIRLGEARYMGAPTDAVFSVAIGYLGDLQIELCRPENAAPSIYTGDYAVTDRPHHLCFVVDDIAKAYAACADVGAKLILEGKVGAHGAVIYADAGGGPGNLLEFVQLDTGGLEFFAFMRDAARDWDGSAPLRKPG